MTFGIPSEGKMLKYLRCKIDSMKLTAKDLESSHTTLNASPVCVGFSSGWFHLQARSLPLVTNHNSTVVLCKRHLSPGLNTHHFLVWGMSQDWAVLILWMRVGFRCSFYCVFWLKHMSRLWFPLKPCVSIDALCVVTVNHCYMWLSLCCSSPATPPRGYCS